MNLLFPTEQNPLESMTVESLDWDTRVLGLQTARISEIRNLKNAASIPLNSYATLGEKLKQAGLQYVTVRQPQHEWAQIHRLEFAGFHLLDGILEFSKKAEKSSPVLLKRNFTLRVADTKDADALAEFSGRSFSQTRFHNDPVLSKEQAARIFSEWARNCCMGITAQAVWLAEENGRIVGFVTCKINDGNGVIDLIGIDAKVHGQGLGTALMTKAGDWFAEKGCANTRIQTQTNNLAAIGLYGKLGFAPILASVTLRWSGLIR